MVQLHCFHVHSGACVLCLLAIGLLKQWVFETPRKLSSATPTNFSKSYSNIWVTWKHRTLNIYIYIYIYIYSPMGLMGQNGIIQLIFKIVTKKLFGKNITCLKLNIVKIKFCVKLNITNIKFHVSYCHLPWWLGLMWFFE